MSTAPERFPLIHGMWPVKGITAGGSPITFFGEHLDGFFPLGAYFIPPENSTLPPLYGFAYSGSVGRHYLFPFALIHVAEWTTVWLTVWHISEWSYEPKPALPFKNYITASWSLFELLPSILMIPVWSWSVHFIAVNFLFFLLEPRLERCFTSRIGVWWTKTKKAWRKRHIQFLFGILWSFKPVNISI